MAPIFHENTFFEEIHAYISDIPPKYSLNKVLAYISSICWKILFKECKLKKLIVAENQFRQYCKQSMLNYVLLIYWKYLSCFSLAMYFSWNSKYDLQCFTKKKKTYIQRFHRIPKWKGHQLSWAFSYLPLAHFSTFAVNRFEM